MSKLQGDFCSTNHVTPVEKVKKGAKPNLGETFDFFIRNKQALKALFDQIMSDYFGLKEFDYEPAQGFLPSIYFKGKYKTSLFTLKSSQDGTTRVADCLKPMLCVDLLDNFTLDDEHRLGMNNALLTAEMFQNLCREFGDPKSMIEHLNVPYSIVFCRSYPKNLDACGTCPIIHKVGNLEHLILSKGEVRDHIDELRSREIVVILNMITENEKSDKLDDSTYRSLLFLKDPEVFREKYANDCPPELAQVLEDYNSRVGVTKPSH